MKNINKRLLTKIAVCLIIVFVFSVSTFVVAHAGSNREPNHGYFSNDLSYSSEYVLPKYAGDPDGLAIPNSINKVDAFLNFLKSYNQSGDNKKVTSSAFIVYTMLGKPGDAYDKNISAVDWDELRVRLNDRLIKGKISWNSSYLSCTGSYYQTDLVDDTFFYNKCPIDTSSILFRDNSNTVIYAISRISGNPMGDLPGLPDVAGGAAANNPNSMDSCRPISLGKVPDYVSDMMATVYAVNEDDHNMANVEFGVYESGSTIDYSQVVATATIKLTTGDRWTLHYDFSDGYSAPTVSIGPCSDYSLEARVNDISTNLVESGAQVSFVPSVDHVSWTKNHIVQGYNPSKKGDFYKVFGTHTKNRPAEWQVTKIIIPPPYPPDYDYKSYYYKPKTFYKTNEVGGDKFTMLSNLEPCTYYRSIIDTLVLHISCEPIKSGSNTVFNPDYKYEVEGGGVPKGVPKYDTTKLVLYDDGHSNDPWVNDKTYPLGSSNQYKYLPINIGDHPVGTRVCFAFSFTQNRSDSSDGVNGAQNATWWSHSNISTIRSHDKSEKKYTNYYSLYINCVTVVKKPKVQVTGGDLSTGHFFSDNDSVPADYAGSEVTTSSSVKLINGTQYIFGSWSEYGIFATGKISGMASGSAFARPGGLVWGNLNNECHFSPLSFRNVAPLATQCDENTDKGYYRSTRPTRPIPDVEASFPGGDDHTISVGDNVTPSTLDSGTYVVGDASLLDGDITLNTSTLQPGKSVIIKATGVVTIAGDQKYDSTATYDNISDIPQLVIIANRIHILGEVKNVDAWLIAKNTLNTCSSISATDYYEGNLTASGICGLNQLTINGPVMTNALLLRRAYGSGTQVDDSGVPAEIFNLRADAYLWGLSRATGIGRIQTVYTTELPPRF